MTRTKLRVIVAISSVAAIGLGACSSSGGLHASSGGSQEQVGAVLAQLVQCIRAHGAPNFPDGTVDGNGVVHFPPNAPRVPEAAQQACRPIFDRLPPQPDRSPPVSQAVFQRWLGFARCMRQQGLTDWPDPNPDGSFTLPQRILAGGKALTLRYQLACDHLNPDPAQRINVEG